MYFNYTKMYDKELIQKRAGNAKSVVFPCETVPKGIQGLQDCEPYTGHDSYLGMAYGIIDCIISKRLRCLLLLKYGKYMSVSSSSLMHKPEIAGVDNIDNIPSDFAYGISFSCNLRLIKLIVSDWAEETITEIVEFVSHLKQVLQSEGVKMPKGEKPLLVHLEPHEYGEQKICQAKADMNEFEVWGILNLIILEQLLRYTKEVLWLDTDVTIRDIYNVETLGEKGIFYGAVMTKRQIETIISQRKNHKRLEWHEICNVLKEVL